MPLTRWEPPARECLQCVRSGVIRCSSPARARLQEPPPRPGEHGGDAALLARGFTSLDPLARGTTRAHSCAGHRTDRAQRVAQRGLPGPEQHGRDGRRDGRRRAGRTLRAAPLPGGAGLHQPCRARRALSPVGHEREQARAHLEARQQVRGARSTRRHRVPAPTIRTPLRSSSGCRREAEGLADQHGHHVQMLTAACAIARDRRLTMEQTLWTIETP